MKQLGKGFAFTSLALMVFALSGPGLASESERDQMRQSSTPALTDQAVSLNNDQVEEIVRRSYQYVAMYNVINKSVMGNAARTDSNGWNTCVADTVLKDHTLKDIARPNNDTLYTVCIVDLRSEPVIIQFPAFDTTFAALETSAYDHYCDIPLSTTKGDFNEPETMLFYSARTKDYTGGSVKGVDTVMELSGDFAIVFLRVMPHASEPERMQKNLAAMQRVTTRTLSEYRGLPPKPVAEPDFPPVGSDFDVFQNSFAEVMQFVVNHTTFDDEDEMDQAALAALKPIGIEPGKDFDPAATELIDGKALLKAAQGIAREAMAVMTRPEGNPFIYDTFKPKGQMALEPMVFQSVVGPIGVPADQAIYPPVITSDGEPMSALDDYVIRMSEEQLPPSRAFWSVTLYDKENGFFIPNDRKKYSVGENAGFALDEDGGIEIHIAAEQPEGVPEENWLPINRQDEALDVVMRIYDPDMERMKIWQAPTADRISRQ
jgi:hypothetical protein